MSRWIAAVGAAKPSCEGFAHHLFRGQKAIASLEFALMLPVLLILLFGTAETLRVVRAKMLLNAAVSAAAAVVSSQQGATTSPGCANGSCAASSLQDICQGAMHMMQGLETTTFSMSIAAVTNADTTNPGRNKGSVAVVPLIQWQVYQACPNRGTTFPVTGAGAPTVMATPLIPYDDNVAIVVQGSFSYTPAFAYGIAGILGPSTSGVVKFTSTSLVEPWSGALPCEVAATLLTCPPTD